MKDTLKALGRKILGRHAHRLGLDARPVAHVMKPLAKLRARLREDRDKHIGLVVRNNDEIFRLRVENDGRLGEFAKSQTVAKNLSALLDE